MEEEPFWPWIGKPFVATKFSIEIQVEVLRNPSRTFENLQENSSRKTFLKRE